MPDYKNVEELKEQLKKEFFPEDPVEEGDEIVEDDDSEDEVSGDEVFDSEPEEEPEEEAEEDSEEDLTVLEAANQIKPVSKKEKEEFAFKKLREEADVYKKKVMEYEAKLKDLGELSELANSLGYKDYKEMVDENRRKIQDAEAKKKGIDPQIYRELQELKKRAEESEQREKTMAFIKTLDEFVSENGLTADDRGAIVKNLDEDGWELGKLLNYPNPKKLLKGYAADLIVERKTQKVIDEKKKKFAEKPFKPEAPVSEDVIDAEVKRKLKAYADKNNYKY